MAQVENVEFQRAPVRPGPDGAANLFRNAMRRHAAGVCIVSVGTGQAVNGVTVSSATSFSMEPAAVLFCINSSASIVPQLGSDLPFSLTVLGQRHQAVAQAFSCEPSGRIRFDSGPWIFYDDTTPWLKDAPANIRGRVTRTLAYGSHIAVIGLVVGVDLGEDTPSLLYRDGKFF